MNSPRLKAISEFPVPLNMQDVQRFLSLAAYFRSSLPEFSEARVLYKLLNKRARFEWTSRHQHAFEVLRSSMLQEPVSLPFDPRHETELHTDASSVGLAGMLLQCPVNGQQCLVHAVSRRTSELERNYDSGKLEFTALIWSLTKFHSLLKNARFKVVTDCKALTSLNEVDLRKCWGRKWRGFLEAYDMEVEYRAAVKLAHVDALSRAPTGPPETEAGEYEMIEDVLGELKEERM